MESGHQGAIALPLGFPVQFLVSTPATLSRQAGGQLFSDDGREAYLTSDPVFEAVSTLTGFVQTDKITEIWPLMERRLAATAIPFRTGCRDDASRWIWYSSCRLAEGSRRERDPVGPSPVTPRRSRRRRGSRRLRAHRRGEVGHPAEPGKVRLHDGVTWHELHPQGEGLFIGDTETAEKRAAAEYPNWSTFKDELGKGQYPPRLYQFNEIGDIVGRTADAIIRSGEDAKAALEAAQSQVTPLLNT